MCGERHRAEHCQPRAFSFHRPRAHVPALRRNVVNLVVVADEHVIKRQAQRAREGVLEVLWSAVCGVWCGDVDVRVEERDGAESEV